MNIQPINNISKTVIGIPQRNHPVFKGLWGENTFYEQHDSTYDISDTICHYYPFKDETKDEIYNIQQKYSLSNGCRIGGGSDPHACYSDVSVEVHEKLPFTAQEFKKYMENCLYDLRKKVIENTIMEKKLKLHI